jgi:hypothetical protein
MKKVFLVIFLAIALNSAVGQVELVPVEHRVYDFLRRMDAKGVIDFNPAVVPVSRRDVSGFLKVVQVNGSNLNKNDNMLLNDFEKEFEFELRAKEFYPQISQINANGKTNDWVNENKYIVKYIDTNVAVWGHLTGGLYQRNSVGDSVGAKKFLAGDLGIEIRGTLFNRVGFELNYSNGRVFAGNVEDKNYVNIYDAFFRSASSFKYDGKYFDHFKGYIRYEVPKRWLAVMVGKENVKQGFGFVDNLFLSGTIPYPMMKIDLKYKAIGYSFSYGNINGDSAGVVDLPNKMISTHRLDVKFAKWLRVGFNESLISSESAFNFEHFNPLSFIVSADLNSGARATMINNSLMGFDVEVKPVKNIVIQGSFLIDDVNFSTITKGDSTANDNKFGYQAGILWNDAFMLDGLSAVMEYTRIDPFTYSHRENKNQYTNRGLSLGHHIPPNSDEIAFKFDYNVMARFSLGLLFQFQRSGEGFIYDSSGNLLINYGGNINYGVNDLYGNKNVFLQGNRINRSLFTLRLYYEPIRQFSLEFKYTYKYENLIYLSSKIKDHFLFMNLGVKI